MKTLVLLLLASSSLSSCYKIKSYLDKIKEKQSHTQNSETKQGARTKGASAEDLLTIKVNAYTECLNKVSDSVFRSEKRYISWIKDVKEGPTCKEKNIHGLYQVALPPSFPANVPKISCVDFIEQKYTSPPRIKDLEEAGLQYIKIARALATLTQEVNEYYTQKYYKADNCRKGQIYHKNLMAHFKNFDVYDRKIRAGVRRENQKQQEQRLVSHEKKYGRSLYWHVQVVMRDSERLVMSVQRELSAPTLNKNNLDQHIGSFEKTVAAFEEEYRQPKFTSGPKMQKPEYFREVLMRFNGSAKEIRRIKSWDKKNARDNEYKVKTFYSNYGILMDQINHTPIMAH